MYPSLHGLKLSALLAICQAIEQALDLESALDGVLSILSENLSMKRATVTLYDPETKQLSINASYGLSLEEKQRGVYRLDEGVTGRIFQTGESYYVPDISKEPLFLDKTGARKIERAKTGFIGVPIILHSDPIGVLNVDRIFGDHVAAEEDVDFLKIVATLIGQFISLNEKIMEREAALKRENTSLKYQISKKTKGLYIVGQSSAMVEVQRQLEKVAPTKATVLLLGESGVGKTLMAKIIHELSDRARHPFIKVNCASIPENLLESELFGHEKGSFTGAASTRPGRFEEADGGTIFLDEIGEFPMSLQAKLLRVLQEKELERIGSNKTRNIDVRILAATNRDLGLLVERNEFRLDLYYRLNIFPITVPPLRERKEDITGLLNYFIQKMAEDYGRKMFFTPAALDSLMIYDWPGNVREMQNLLERLVIMSDSEYITLEFLKSYLAPGQRGVSNSSDGEVSVPASNDALPHCTSLKEVERNEVVAALERSGWIQYKAAETLGLSARQMGYRVKRYGLESMIAEGRARLRRMKKG
ncbi:nif-specific transcriptional activator NifA [Desulfovibrio sp. JC022]|uniref:nif-specific transcriptional activator NifA n=1 Tax=Desulfovibrio sp. JC022 TaxID=2593642 RepID=UPI0013D4A95C|nr:nif-specific transcriptional activator NifA [Desulfovibrio sp. JC022]NDV23378.1 nif-specific transcriptional activator NifA [Desulfovibrio sp. JC022]